ncbi:hypothetical protein NDU88_007525 [Pleurodeles waltl]|uniref:Reverse transcriptase domain-containing protein n=1 Tax=Pleurodeles waltl TaxID=8319 RepID=A0AAV7RQC9_PLEWA|nr:hypothetical protein NDU88_007525 [Pleurodeles waltl]
MRGRGIRASPAPGTKAEGCHRNLDLASPGHKGEKRDRAGVAKEDLLAIARTFATYYECLYAQVPQPPAEREKPILGDIPSLLSFLTAELDLPLLEEELEDAISALQSGKTAGPDGYPVEYYKQLQSHLIAPLVGAYEEALHRGSFTQGQDCAPIVVIPKDDLPWDQCSSYQPILLINADIKIFAKVLATRLVRMLPHLVHHAQCGLMPGRSKSHCLRRVQAALSQADRLGDELALLLVDFSKAFAAFSS